MDLFNTKSPLDLPLVDADLRLLQEVELGVDYQQLMQQLIADTGWREQAIRLWGQSRLQPRLFAWHGDSGSHYSYSGITLAPAPWTTTLQALKSRVEKLAGYPFNSVLLNYYRDHRDSMGLHSDDERELGPRPVIASLSLGEERTLVLKHKSRPELKPIRLPLAAGSLLIMAGDTQRHWKHGIPKESRPRGARLNLTFRQILKL